MLRFWILVVTAAAVAGAPSAGARFLSERLEMCRLADRNDDGCIDRRELRDFLKMFGAIHTRDDDKDEDEFLAARIVAILQRVQPDAGGAYASCATLFHYEDAISDEKNVEQFHLALTGDPSERRLTFAALGHRPIQGDEDNAAKAELECTLSDGRNFSAQAYTYTVPSRWWQPHGWVGSLYNVTFTQLQAGQTYGYSCLGSAIGTFHVPALPQASSTSSSVSTIFPTRFATFGDMGTFMPLGFDVFRALERSHASVPFDFVIHQGDISYAGIDTAVPALNISSDDELEYIWDLFGRQIEPLAKIIPWMVGVGNHEAWYNFSAFRARYPMPSEASGGEDNFWYSFDYAGVHVVSASSEHDLSDGSAQLEWIARDLRAANRNRRAVPWILFAIHRPLYSSDADEYPEHSPGSFRLRQLEDLLLENNVDLTVTGHQHAYERCHPARNGTVLSWPHSRWNAATAEYEDVYNSPGAPVHLMVGSAGAFQHEKWINPSPIWSGKRFNQSEHADDLSGYIDGYGFVRVTLWNETHLSATFESVNGESSSFADTFWVTK